MEADLSPEVELNLPIKVAECLKLDLVLHQRHKGGNDEGDAGV